MSMYTRRDALKVLGTAALVGTGAISARRANAAPELKYQPEKGATLRVLRWKNFVQGAEDQFQLNTRNFIQRSGVNVSLESVAIPDVPAKAALAAHVNAGPDIGFSFYDLPHLYADKCLDLSDLARYLGDRYGGWYDTCKRYCTSDGHWIALGAYFATYCVGVSTQHGRGGWLSRDSARSVWILKALQRTEGARGTNRIRPRQR